VALEKVLPVEIFPNPMTDQAIVRIQNPDHLEYKMVIRDFSGKTVRMMEPINGEEIMISREDLGRGYYIVEISGDHRFRGKLIVE
jgi:hypothetical protein